MSRGRWLAIVVPFVLMPALAFAIANTPLGTMQLHIGVELDTLVLILGLLGSTLLIAVLLLRSRGRSDIQRALRQAQAEASGERRRFLRRLDHELKNPLTAIRAGLANLAIAEGNGAWSEARTSVESQILRLSRLTSDLRKLADLGTRSLEERSPVDLAELLREAFEAAQARPSAEQRSMTLVLPQAPWPLPQVGGDRDLLFLAVFNLMDNALKFTNAGDTVEVRAFEDGANVVVEVADTGIGIPEGEIPMVWEELYRGQEAHGIPGSGLGLSLVRAIVEQHAGRVDLRSRPEHGTVITIRLPIDRTVTES